MLLFHLFRLLLRALIAMPSLISGNWLSTLLPVAVFLIKEAATLRQGWSAMRGTIKRDFWIMCAVYGVLFSWAVVRTIYNDHSDLVEQSRALNKSLADKSDVDASILRQVKDSLGESITGLRVQCGILEGMNRSLGQQNRDQQNLISGCQTQALNMLAKSQVPLVSAFQIIRERPEGSQIEYVLTTTTTRSRTEITVSCDIPISKVTLSPMSVNGTANYTGGIGDGPISLTAYRVGITSPPWTNEFPLYAAIFFSSPPTRPPTCNLTD